ncbi:MAG: AMP-binding protein [Cytophagales bacterium]|nr:AMP-binding protein [Rhizobacter sp.]
MEKVWLNQYPKGIPALANLDEFSSLKHVLEESVRRFGPLPAYSNMGGHLSYHELDVASRNFGAYLQHSLKLKRGARVAIMLPNLLQYPVALFGALRAGYTVVSVNPQYTPRELAHQLTDSGAEAIVVLENFAHTLQEVLEKNKSLQLTVLTTEVGDMLPLIKEFITNAVVKYVKKMVPPWRIAHAIEFNAALREGHALTLDEVQITHDDIAFLQYTGGTTGVAKGVMLTHGNMVANVQQMSLWVGRNLEDGKEICVIPLPLYHVYALLSNLVFMKIGAQVMLITNPRDLPAFIADLKKQPFTGIIAVNTLYAALLDAPAFADVDVRHLKMTSAGGMAVQRVVAEKWKALTGTPIIEGYGLTETSPVVIANPLDIKDWTGTIGVPIPSTEAIILDDDGAPMALGDVGEICVRGPQVMKGYWNRPDETALAFADGGWLRTGDMGFMNERGYFKITDRKKDMIIVSGFKVFPNEIEDVISAHPGVREVAAVGVQDDRSGEAVKIFVVRRDESLTEAQLLAYCRQHLTGYKVPRFIEFRTEPLPKSSIGKTLRRELRQGSAPQPSESKAAT